MSSQTPIQDLMDDVEACIETGSVAYISGPPGCGKCFGRGTLVRMYDGSVKTVETVEIGDLLMGPDSKPRQVVSLARGREKMYRVVPVKGDSYVVNESHILSLKMSPQSPGDARKVVNVEVKDYLGRSNNFKHHAKGWRSPVDWPRRDVALPPYILGVWLGHGHVHSPTVTTAEPEVVEELQLYAEETGMELKIDDAHEKAPNYRFSTGEGPGLPRSRNDLIQFLRSVGLFETKEKFIPDAYKINCREVQLEVLAGLIDTDGYLNNGCWDMTMKDKALVDGICFLARSLGLAAYAVPCRKECVNTGVWGDYFRITISGNLSMVPCRVPRRKASPRTQIKDVLMTGIELEPLDVDDYFGFEVDGDHLFLLEDFTVVHNSQSVKALAKRRGGAFAQLIGSICDPTDLCGFPVVVPGSEELDADGRKLPTLRFAPREIFTRLNREGGILFLDELSCAPAAVQAAMLTAICDWRFGDYQLDKHRVGIVAAGNPADIATNGTELSGPMQNRLAHLEYPVDQMAKYEWCSQFPGYWGSPPKIGFGGEFIDSDALVRARSFVAGYIRREPSQWLDARFSSEKEDKKARRKAGTDDQTSPAWASPRSWERVANHLAHALHKGRSPISAARRIEAEIGKPAIPFLTYLRETSLPDPEALLANPDGYSPSGRLDLDFATTLAVVAAFEAKVSASRYMAAWKICHRAVSHRGDDGRGSGSGPAYEAGMAAAHKLVRYFRGDKTQLLMEATKTSEWQKMTMETTKLSKPFMGLIKQVAGINQ